MTCMVCGKRAYSEYCTTHKPRKPLKRTPLKTTRKPIKQAGKISKKWTSTRAQWFKDNPAEYYLCYLCSRRIDKSETTLDHVVPRSRAPHLRFEPSNLKPCCWTCNAEKGSKVLT